MYFIISYYMKSADDVKYPGMCACVYLMGQWIHFPHDVTLRSSKSSALFSSFVGAVALNLSVK